MSKIFINKDRPKDGWMTEILYFALYGSEYVKNSVQGT